MDNALFPTGHQQVMPYLVIEDAEGFIRFMQDVFGAREKMRFMTDNHTIAHAEITIGASVIMVTNATRLLQPCTGGGFIYVTDADAVYEKAL